MSCRPGRRTRRCASWTRIGIASAVLSISTPACTRPDAHGLFPSRARHGAACERGGASVAQRHPDASASSRRSRCRTSTARWTRRRTRSTRSARPASCCSPTRTARISARRARAAAREPCAPRSRRVRASVHAARTGGRRRSAVRCGLSARHHARAAFRLVRAGVPRRLPALKIVRARRRLRPVREPPPGGGARRRDRTLAARDPRRLRGLLLRHRAVEQPGCAADAARVREARPRAVRQRLAVRAGDRGVVVRGLARRVPTRPRDARRDRSRQRRRSLSEPA